MNIAGIMVVAQPSQMLTTSDNLTTLSGVEIHACADNGKMVLTVEAYTEQEIADTLCQIQTTQGVLSAAMVYHSFDDHPDMSLENLP